MARENSISRFAAVSDCQQHDLFSIVAIENDVRSVAELDDPLAKFMRHIVDGSTNFGLGGENPDSLPDGFDCSCGSFTDFRAKEVEVSDNVAQG